MKSNEKWIRISLFLLVLLSFYFSLSIWLSSAKKEQVASTDTQSTATVNERSNTDVFLPLRLIRSQEGKTEINNSENLIVNVQSEIKKSSFGELAQIVFENEDEFANYLSLDEGIELNYEGVFSLEQYLSVYSLNINSDNLPETDKITFNCIQIDLVKNKLRFLNFKENNIYETDLTINKENLSTILDKTTTVYTQISSQKYINGQFYYFSESLQMKKYSYILASQPITKFRNSFFTNLDEIQTNEDSSDLSYSTNTEHLTVDEAAGNIHFEGTIEANEENDIYLDSYNYIKKLGTGMGNLRYFDRNGTSLTYQTFVEGYPVFSEDNKGQVKIAIDTSDKDKELVTIDTSIDTIQVPIPSDEEVTLESTEELLENLESNKVELQKISSMVIGYTWHKIEEISQVVDLTPEWYIRYDNQWYSKTDLLQKVADSEVS